MKKLRNVLIAGLVVLGAMLAVRAWRSRHEVVVFENGTGLSLAYDPNLHNPSTGFGGCVSGINSCFAKRQALGRMRKGVATLQQRDSVSVRGWLLLSRHEGSTHGEEGMNKCTVGELLVLSAVTGASLCYAWDSFAR